jgi:hypothetical protein
MKAETTKIRMLIVSFFSISMICIGQQSTDEIPWAKNKDFVGFKTSINATVQQLRKDVDALKTMDKIDLWNTRKTRVAFLGYGPDESGLFNLYDKNGKEKLKISADNDQCRVDLTGRIYFQNRTGKNIVFIGSGGDSSGFINLNDRNGKSRLHMGAFAGGSRILLKNTNDSTVVSLGMNSNKDGLINLFNKNHQKMIDLYVDNDQGRIDLHGGSVKDYSEIFEFLDKKNIKEGTVVSMDKTGKGLVPSGMAYDTKVVGVISGAGGLQSGMRVGTRNDGTNDLPVAVSGQVYVRICPENGPVEVGDLLVSSGIPGVAMKAGPEGKTNGTVIGKAIEPYHDRDKKEGLVRMMVMLR